MKPKTEAGKTRPDPTKKDCDLLDRTIDLVLLYRQYESEPELLAGTIATVNDLRKIAKRCNELLEATAKPPDAAGGKPEDKGKKPK